MGIDTKPKRLIKHPSWRVYKAIADTGLDLKDFGLKDIPVCIPYIVNDDLTDELCRALADTSYKDGPYEILPCLEMFMVPDDRQLIEAMLLNGKSLSEICDVMGCNETFTMTYSSLFFDTKIFKNNIEKLVYVKEGTCGDEAITKSNAMYKGDEYLKAKSGLPSSKLNMDMVLTDTFAKAYLAMNSNADVDDVGSQEVAQGWANIMLKVAAHLSKTGSSGGCLEDLIIALQTTPTPKRSFDELD